MISAELRALCTLVFDTMTHYKALGISGHLDGVTQQIARSYGVDAAELKAAFITLYVNGNESV